MNNLTRLEIIFHSGDPDGIRICLRQPSAVKAFVIPRSCLSEAQKLSGVDRPGVYFLLNDEAGSMTELYIGRTQSGIARLEAHNAKKPFGNKAILFLADQEQLTLNVLCGLEKFAIEKAMDARLFRIDNKTVPRCTISEYDLPLVEELYREIEFIMAAFGYRLNGTRPLAPHRLSTDRHPFSAAEYALSHPVIRESLDYQTDGTAG